MRFTFADDAPVTPPRPARQRPLQHVLTFVLGVMAAFAAYEIVTFAQDYWRALHPAA